MAQVKPLKLLPNGNFAQLNSDNDDLTISSLTSKQLVITSGDVGEKIVVQANPGDSETKLFNIKNSSGVSVASIDEDGDMIVNDLQVNGAETVVGTITAQSDLDLSGSLSAEGNLFAEGNLSVSGNVTLGDNSADNITFNGTSSSNLNMGSNYITNLAYPSNPTDGATKQYVDDNLSSSSWSVSGNSLSTPTTTEFFGSVNSADVIFKRNNVEFLRLTTDGYTFGGLDFLSEGSISNNLFNGNNTIRFETKDKSSTDDSYYMLIRTGNTDQGRSGDLEIGTGGSTNGDSGDAYFFTADAPNGNRGHIYLDSAQVNVISNIQPLFDNTYSVGASGFQWTDVYASGFGTATTGDVNLFRDNVTIMTLGSSQVDVQQEMDMNSNKIVGVADPTSALDAVNLQTLQNAVGTEVQDLRIPFTASGAIAAGAPVYVLQTADETVAEGDASTIDTSRLIGIAETSISNGATGLVTIGGFAEIPTSQIDGGSFDVGLPVFLSETTGHLTKTAPTTPGSRIYQVGLAVSTTKIVIDLKQGATIE